MTKRTNRVAWGLVGVLTAVLLGAPVVFGVLYRKELLRGEEFGRISLAPRDCWGFGWSTLHMSFGPGGLNRRWFVVGCIAWRAEYDPPLTSPTSPSKRSWWGEVPAE
jgi:hypothetical protein